MKNKNRLLDTLISFIEKIDGSSSKDEIAREKCDFGVRYKKYLLGSLIFVILISLVSSVNAGWFGFIDNVINVITTITSSTTTTIATLSYSSGNLSIITDKLTYHGITGDDVYLTVNSSSEEITNISVIFPNNISAFPDTIEKNVSLPYITTQDIYANNTYMCKVDWQTNINLTVVNGTNTTVIRVIFPNYYCVDPYEIRKCSEGSDKKTCYNWEYVNTIPTGITYTAGYVALDFNFTAFFYSQWRTEWGKVDDYPNIKNTTKATDYLNTKLGKTEYKILETPIVISSTWNFTQITKDDFQTKFKTKSKITNDVINGSQTYKIHITYPINSQGEFWFILTTASGKEIVVDPFWNSTIWQDYYPLTITNNENIAHDKEILILNISSTICDDTQSLRNSTRLILNNETIIPYEVYNSSMQIIYAILNFTISANTAFGNLSLYCNTTTEVSPGNSSLFLGMDDFEQGTKANWMRLDLRGDALDSIVTTYAKFGSNSLQHKSEGNGDTRYGYNFTSQTGIIYGNFYSLGKKSNYRPGIYGFDRGTIGNSDGAGVGSSYLIADYNSGGTQSNWTYTPRSGSNIKIWNYTDLIWETWKMTYDTSNENHSYYHNGTILIPIASTYQTMPSVSHIWIGAWGVGNDYGYMDNMFVSLHNSTIYETPSAITIGAREKVTAGGGGGSTFGTPMVLDANITPTTVYTGGTLFCNASVGNATRISWKVYNGTTTYSTGNALIAANITLYNYVNITTLKKSEVWKCGFMAENGTTNSTELNTTAITVSNTAPTNYTSTQITQGVYTDGLITLTASGSIDVDGDTITPYCQFSNASTTLQAYSTTCTFNCNTSGCDKGSVISGLVKGYDGADYGLAAGNSTTILNSLPTNHTSVSLTQGAYTDSLLTCSGSGSTDADGDTITPYYQFSNSSTTLQAYSITVTFNCNISGCDKGSVITCLVKGNDGTGYSVESGNSSTILNSAPTQPTVSITTTFARTNDEIVCSASSSTDADGDTITYYYRFNDSANILQDYSATATLNCNVSGCDKNDVLTCYSKATTTDANSTIGTSGTLTIQNSNPQITLSSPPDNLHNNTNLSASFTPFDSDADTFSCQLYVNNQINDSATGIVNGTSTTLRSYINTDGNYTWFINCSDGTNNTATVARTFFLDTINPLITQVNPLADNSTKIRNNSITPNIQFFDTNLYQTLCNFTNSSGQSIYQDYQLDINLTTYNCTTAIDLLGYIDQNITLTAEATDDHTRGNKIPNGNRKSPTFLQFNDSLVSLEISASMLKKNGQITTLPLDFDAWILLKNISPLPPQCGVCECGCYVLTQTCITPCLPPIPNNHLKFGFNFTVDKNNIYELRLYLNSTTTLKYREPVSKIKGHFVWGGYYIDFQDAVDSGFDVNITILSNKEAYVDIRKNWTEGTYLVVDPVVGGLNTVSQTSHFVLDRSNPSVTINLPLQNSNYSTKKVELNISPTDPEGISNCWYSLNNFSTNTTFSNCTSVMMVAGVGTNVVWVGVNDTSGNINSSESRTFNVDATNPSCIFTSPTLSANTTFRWNNTINITCNDFFGNLQNVTLKIWNSSGLKLSQTFIITGYGDWRNFTWQTANGSYEDGYYYINATVYDTADNYNFSATRNYSVDNTEPKFSAYGIDISAPNEQQNVTVNVTIYETHLDKVIIELKNDNLSILRNFTVTTSTSLGANNYSFYFTIGLDNLSAHDNVSYRWFANDTLGNNNWSVTQNFTVSNRAPVLTQIGNKRSTTNTTISFVITATDLDREDVTNLRFSKNVTYGSLSEVTGDFIWVATVGLGDYPLKFNVSDGYSQDSEDINITLVLTLGDGSPVGGGGSGGVNSPIPLVTPSTPSGLTILYTLYTIDTGYGTTTSLPLRVKNTGLSKIISAKIVNTTCGALITADDMSGISVVNISKHEEETNIELKNITPVEVGKMGSITFDSCVIDMLVTEEGKATPTLVRYEITLRPTSQESIESLLNSNFVVLPKSGTEIKWWQILAVIGSFVGLSFLVWVYNKLRKL